jgi:hypothetical protein
VCAGEVGPSEEACNGFDDDCDGLVDEGCECVTGDTRPCGSNVGECQEGTETCDNGTWSGVCAGEVGPALEVCNGLDDDCDGVIDDGNPGGGGSCSTGLSGICEAGTLTCENGGLVCSQNTSATTEVCNGLDDDCDGVIDDGNPGGGGSCSTGLSGICEAGTLTCENGGLVCSQNTSATTEVCNGLDDDCDGVIDEDFPVGSACVVGTEQGIYICAENGFDVECIIPQ